MPNLHKIYWYDYNDAALRHFACSNQVPCSSCSSNGALVVPGTILLELHDTMI